MNVKDDYQCTCCTKVKSCFVFNEFSFPLALCMECYIHMKTDRAQILETENTCLLCDTTNNTIKPFKTENTMLLNMVMNICQECFTKLARMIEEGRYL
jgi:hypothetical protein